jgi:hypothetical protein
MGGKARIWQNIFRVMKTFILYTDNTVDAYIFHKSKMSRGRLCSLHLSLVSCVWKGERKHVRSAHRTEWKVLSDFFSMLPVPQAFKPIS